MRSWRSDSDQLRGVEDRMHCATLAADQRDTRPLFRIAEMPLLS